MPVLLWILLFAFLCAVLYAAAGYAVFLFAFRRFRLSPRARYERRAEMSDIRGTEAKIAQGLRYADACCGERVYIRARDGVRLAGRLLGDGSAGVTLLLFHGYRSFAEHDFGCVLPFYLEEMGYRVLLADQRAHGESEGKYITFGVRESEDCVAWAEYVYARFGEKENIFLDGISMGASCVLLAAGGDLPPTVRGVIADCGYTSPLAILRHAAAKYRLPLSSLLPAAALFCRVFAGVDLRKGNVPAALRSAHLPVLLVHGMADDFVPMTMGMENARAAGKRASVRYVPGAGHGTSYLVDPEGCQQALRQFFVRALSARNAGEVSC